MISKNPTFRLTTVCCVALLLHGLTSTLSAQRVSPGGTGTGPAGATAGTTVTTDENVSERVIVQDVPIEESILPTTRPYTAAFGLDDNILDVPRNVTIISREQLDSVDISSVRDFSKLTSSSFTTTNFGAPSNPSLRGTTADVLLNGQRRGLTSNGNGLPLDFNQVESVSILKGPPPAIYGASQYVGGFIDLVTKRPYFDKFQGSVSGTVGLYDQNRYTLDFGGPIIKDKLAGRISYSGEESGSFYENGNQSTQSVYGALTWMPNAKYRLELNASFFQADYVENFGVNRPTQALIDHGRYTTGFVIDQNGDGLRNNRDVNSGGNPIIPTGTIDLNRSRRLLAPGDGSFGREIEAQAIQTLALDDHFTLVNNLYFNYIKRDTRSSYYYSEVVDNDYVIDDRTELRGKFETTVGGGQARSPGPDAKDAQGHRNAKDAKDAKQVADAIPGKGIRLIDSFNTGIDIRYQHTLAYDDYFNEPSNTWDLSAPRSDIAYVNFVADLPIPGHPDRLATPGVINGDTGDTNLVQGGVFLQNEFRFGPAALLTGGRGDFVYVHFADPVTFGGDIGDDTVTVIPDANISLTYDITPKITAYGTFNYSQYTHVGVGGGLTPGFGSQYNANDFHNESFLEEGGIKASLLKDTLFVNLAAFHQTRGFSGAGGAITPIDAKGIEIEGNWQPNKNFYLTAGYTLTEAFLYHQNPGFVSQLAPLDKLPVNADGTITLDSGGVYTNPDGTLKLSNYRQPGLPEHLFNFLATYKFDFGLGASLGTVVTGPIHSDYTGNLRIPWQYTMDLTVFYTYKRYEARIAFLNVTDQDNWAPPNPVYGDGSILRDLPFRVEGSFKIRF